MDDQAELRTLVDAARRRDGEAVARLFDRYYPGVYRYAFARLGSVPDAEDAAAETFTAVIRALPNFGWRGVPFEAWLFRIARSKVIDIARYRARTQPGQAGSAPERGDPSADPARIHDAREARLELAAAIDRLPRDQRDVVMLRFFLGRSVRETAQQIGRSEGAIKQLQLRALTRLRRETDR